MEEDVQSELFLVKNIFFLNFFIIIVFLVVDALVNHVQIFAQCLLLLLL